MLRIRPINKIEGCYIINYIINITDVLVKKYRIICDVCVHLNFLYSNTEFAKFVIKARPTLIKHKCKCKSSDAKFSNCIYDTSIAHVFEHLVIDYQVELINNLGLDDTILMGTTQFMDKSKGLSRVEFNYMDDIIAFQSINQATKLINSFVY